MKLEFYNCPQPQNIDEVKFPETPEFVKYKPDFELIKKISTSSINNIPIS